MKNLATALFALVISGSAMAQDGVRVSTDNHAYREVAVTHQSSGILYGTGGVSKLGDRYGLRLSIGPSYVAEDYQVAFLYVVGAYSAKNKNESSSLWNEAEVFMRFKYLGMSVGSFNNSERVESEDRTGCVGTRYYARISLNFQVGLDVGPLPSK